MKRWLFLILVVVLITPTIVQAKHYGPLWAVWTHSEDPKECMVKSIFWISLVTFGGSYVLKKVTEKKSVQFRNNTERNWTPTMWVEQDKNGNAHLMLGIGVRW